MYIKKFVGKRQYFRSKTTKNCHFGNVDLFLFRIFLNFVGRT